jgi:hypothetical protein
VDDDDVSLRYELRTQFQHRYPPNLTPAAACLTHETDALGPFSFCAANISEGVNLDAAATGSQNDSDTREHP